jgi:hypothetical protein
MKPFFEGMTDEQILHGRDLPSQLTIRPSISLSPATSPVSIRWYQSLPDKRTAGAAIAYFLEMGLREAFLSHADSNFRVPPLASTSNAGPVTSTPAETELSPESTRISLTTALGMFP